QGKVDDRSFILVPQWLIEGVGLVDLAVFVPLLNRHRPLVVVETDGHEFHERTPEQASKDRKRVRMLQNLNIAVLPFTGTDVVRGSEEIARETVDFIVADMRRRWRTRGVV